MENKSLKYGLRHDVIEKIQQVLAQFPDIEVAILYGSRAKGNYKSGSDIDLTLKTTAEGSIPLLQVMTTLDDLDLPYTLDVSVFEHIKNNELIEHINRVGIDFFHAKTFSQKKKCQPDMSPEQDIRQVFSDYWSSEKQEAVKQLCEKENMDEKAVYEMIDSYHLSGKAPLHETVFSALKLKPKLLERKEIFDRVVTHLLSIAKTLDDDSGGAFDKIR